MSVIMDISFNFCSEVKPSNADKPRSQIFIYFPRALSFFMAVSLALMALSGNTAHSAPTKEKLLVLPIQVKSVNNKHDRSP